MNTKQFLLDLASWLAFLLFVTTGVINLFWGNDVRFGVFIVILSHSYIPKVGLLFHRITGFVSIGLLKS